ncbi:SET domain-containing protein-lysine N-methyltransferase [Vandammella animalimorsus]|uniref:SET domain-containing protein n=1 Tax=Vandammella animalimorsus TaxID=2029117 RepID=UPI00325A55AF
MAQSAPGPAPHAPQARAPRRARAGAAAAASAEAAADAPRHSGRKTQVRRSGIHGKGVYALRDLEPGERILEYKGERISWREAQRRHARKDGDPCHTFYFQTEQGPVIDGGVQGNSARWINHSCEPNCETEEDEQGRVFIVAIVPIEAGQELFYDYALEIDEPLTAELKKDYACLCGSAQCRGTLLKTRRPRAKAKAKPQPQRRSTGASA